ncbi:hypothetical protein GCM10010266_47250 [Streptomyces griseomycini]|nr:hypothetical protein GCM10010266_47250 [Streptomyces griseomycini]GGR37628.1 hypothetical protein GCM10015536_49380 [Streptomyces griseomycini]
MGTAVGPPGEPRDAGEHFGDPHVPFAADRRVAGDRTSGGFPTAPGGGLPSRPPSTERDDARGPARPDLD